MDIKSLLHALDNNNNEGIIDLDYSKISKSKNDILQQLQFERNDLLIIHKKLKSYRYVDDLKNLSFGGYIRWISLKNPQIIKLTNGGIICDITCIKDEIYIKCKNNMNKIFQIKLSEVIIFQKLTNQEEVILKALKLIEK
jgi:hypothetical protein